MRVGKRNYCRPIKYQSSVQRGKLHGACYFRLTSPHWARSGLVCPKPCGVSDSLTLSQNTAFCVGVESLGCAPNSPYTANTSCSARVAATAKLIQGVRNPPKQEAAAVERDRFSPRERDILASLAQGESNKEIARKLDLAESTVKIHVQNIFKKLNMSSRVQVALYAVENGYGR